MVRSKVGRGHHLGAGHLNEVCPAHGGVAFLDRLQQRNGLGQAGVDSLREFGVEAYAAVGPAAVWPFSDVPVERACVRER